MLIRCQLPGTREFVFIDSEKLSRRFGIYEDGNEFTHWEEFWLDGALVNRSACVYIKQSHEIQLEVGDIANG